MAKYKSNKKVVTKISRQQLEGLLAFYNKVKNTMSDFLCENYITVQDAHDLAGFVDSVGDLFNFRPAKTEDGKRSHWKDVLADDPNAWYWEEQE
jgi:hypothetical protein